MPQIAQLSENWYLTSQLFWLAVVFAGIFFIVGRGMLPKVEATVDARDGKIASDLAAAKASRDSADGIDTDWRNRTNAARVDAQSVIALAKAKAAKDADKRLATANALIETRLSSAEADIGAARTSAMAGVEAVAADAAQDLVARLTGGRVTAAAATQAVKAHLNG